MLNRHIRSVALLSFVWAISACSPAQAQRAVSQAYPAPPRDSYTTIERRVGIGRTEEALKGGEVSPTFFGAAAPVVGRFFVSGEFKSDSSQVVVLHHELWKSKFVGSPSVIGTQIQLDRRPFTVVGVAPLGFNSPDQASFWVPRYSK
jgi:hypothetical protein